MESTIICWCYVHCAKLLIIKKKKKTLRNARGPIIEMSTYGTISS